MKVLLLHSAYGLRPAILDASIRLAAAGHRVRTPDLYDGQTAETIDEALALRDRIGREVLQQRALEATETWEPEAIVGFSLGASIAQRIVLARRAPLRLVLFHGAADVPPGTTSPGLRVQAHIAAGDAFAPDDELTAWELALVEAGAEVELHRHRGGHLFTDPGLPDFDGPSTETAWQLTLLWLATRGGNTSGNTSGEKPGPRA